MIKVLRIFLRDWGLLIRNLKLFVPDILFLVVSGLVGVVLLMIIGLWDVILANFGDVNLFSQSLSSFVETNFVKVFIALALFLVSSFIIGSSTSAMKFGMIDELLVKKKTSIKGGCKLSKKFFLRVVLVKLIVYLIVGVLGFIMFSLLALLSSFFSIFKSFVVSIAVGFGLWLVMRLAFLNIFPIMYFENKGVLMSIKDSYLFFQRKFKYVVSVFLVMVFVIGIFYGFNRFILGRLFGLVDVVFLAVIVNLVINWIPNLWSNLFIFDAYKSGKKVKA